MRKIDSKMNSSKLNISENKSDVIGVNISGSQNIIGKNIYISSPYFQSPEIQVPKQLCTPLFMGERKLFIGRKEEIKEIENKLKSNPYDTVSIVGIGGIGKTSLAFQIIRRCTELYDCIIDIYCEYGISYKNFLIEISRRLGINFTDFEDSESNLEIAIKNKITSSFSKGILLFIDNYERISDSLIGNNPSKDSIKINNFLESVPQNTGVFLTTRNNLNYPVGVERINLKGLNQNEGRELFIEASGDKSLTIQSSKKNDPLDNLIIEEDGHPLSITLYAKNYQGMGMNEIQTMLSSRIAPKDQIRSNSRFYSLESSFDFSFNHLRKDQKLLLQELTIFNSPFPISAITTIFSVEKNEIIQLVNRNFIILIDKDQYGKLDEELWLCSFHPLIKEYLMKKVDEDQIRNLIYIYQEKAYNFYNEFVKDVYKKLVENKDFDFMRPFNLIMKYKNNDIENSVIRIKDVKKKSVILGFLGSIQSLQGLYSKSKDYYEQRLEINLNLEDQAAIADDYKTIGILWYKLGNISNAYQYIEKSLKIHEELDDKYSIADDYNNMGLISHTMLDDLDAVKKAMKYHKKALIIHDELSDEGYVADDYNNMGLLLLLNGFFPESFEYFKASLEIYETENNYNAIANINKNIGLLFYVQGKINKSIEYLQKSKDLYKDLKLEIQLADIYNYLGMVNYAKKNLNEAINFHTKALEIHQKLGLSYRIVVDLFVLFIVYKDKKELQKSEEYFNNCHEFYKQHREEINYNFPLIRKINENIANPSKIKLKDLFKVKLTKFLYNHFKWYISLFLSYIAVSFIIPFPYSLVGNLIVFSTITLLWRKSQLRKISIDEEYLKYSSAYNIQRFFQAIKLFLLSLLFYFPVILFNYRAIKKATLRLGLISIYDKLYKKPKSVIFDPLML